MKKETKELFDKAERQRSDIRKEDCRFNDFKMDEIAYIRLDFMTYGFIKAIANHQGLSISATLRYFLKYGMNSFMVECVRPDIRDAYEQLQAGGGRSELMDTIEHIMSTWED